MATKNKNKSNPYDLSKKKGTAPKIIPAPKPDTKPKMVTRMTAPKELSDIEKSKLVGYKEVRDKTKWSKLPIGADIKYMKKDGVITLGGSIIRHGIKDGNPYILYQHSTLKQPTVLYHHKVEKIWAKPNTVVPESHKYEGGNSNDKTIADLQLAVVRMRQNLKWMNEFMLMKYSDDYRNFMREKHRQSQLHS